MKTCKGPSYSHPQIEFSQGTLAPLWGPFGNCLSHNWLGNIRCVNFFGTCSRLVPDSPALVKEKIVGENYINVMKNEVVRLGDLLKLSSKLVCAS